MRIILQSIFAAQSREMVSVYIAVQMSLHSLLQLAMKLGFSAYHSGLKQKVSLLLSCCALMYPIDYTQSKFALPFECSDQLLANSMESAPTDGSDFNTFSNCNSLFNFCIHLLVS